ncbi:MAG: hypothetical protein LLG00_10485 [Planctomycetaceae bacterium]|nr:hypothetical protein [Planctomycetaceae bacterium]
MIAPEIVADIRRLLEEDRYSQRQIARMLGVSRGSVCAIASGRRPDYESLPKPVDDLLEPAGPPERCPTCGAMVYMPCVLCHLQNELSRRPRSMSAKRHCDAPRLVELELRPEHRLRYEQVREARRSAIARWCGSCTAAPGESLVGAAAKLPHPGRDGSATATPTKHNCHPNKARLK